MTAGSNPRVQVGFRAPARAPAVLKTHDLHAFPRGPVSRRAGPRAPLGCLHHWGPCTTGDPAPLGTLHHRGPSTDPRPRVRERPTAPKSWGPDNPRDLNASAYGRFQLRRCVRRKLSRSFTATLSWVIESRWRTVTTSPDRVSPSIVTQNGVPISSWRR